MRNRVLIFALTIMLMFSLFPVIPVMAADQGQISFGTTYSGVITAQEGSNRYTVVLSKPGRVNLNVDASGANGIGRPRGIWFDASGMELQNEQSFIGSSTLDSYMDLEVGTYYTEIVPGALGTTGAYTLTATFTSAETSGERDNTTLATAQTIASGQTVHGLISHQHEAEYYRILLSEPGRVNLNVDASGANGVGRPRGIWFDANGIELQREQSFIGSSTLDSYMDLNAGTYYIEVVPGALGTTGAYTLTATFGTTAPITHTITATAGTGGTVIGGGTYQTGAAVTLTAAPNSSYDFDGWYENGSRVSPNATWNFTVTANRTLEARFTQQTTSPVTPTAPIQPFIPNNHSAWAEPELIKAAEQNLIPESLKDPSVDYTKPITRAEFAGIAVKTYESLANTTALPAINNQFTDTQAIDALKAYNTGLMVGISDTEFAPNTLLNREQAATALTRVFKRATIPGWSISTDADYSLTFDRPATFADDANISSWAKESVYFMAANGIVAGTGNNMYAPRATTSAEQARGYATATREQALTMAVRMVENLR